MHLSIKIASTTLLLVGVQVASFAGAPAGQLTAVGVAKVDITPKYPVRLSGYGNRRTESEGVEQRIWAKALAIGADRDNPVILITVDNCGVPWSVTKEVASRLHESANIRHERLAICSSHTHCAPMLTGVLPLIFGMPIASDQQRRIDRYTRELTDNLEQVALAALADRRPGRLDWTVGKVSFAINRRSQKQGLPQNGPVDHSLPMLRVLDDKDELRAIFVRYTCHAVALFGDFNRICGDWPGFAQAAIERRHPGCVAMVAIGCAGDQKPNLQSKVSHARKHGEAIAREVDRLLEQDNFRPLVSHVRAKLETIDLPFDTLPARDEWVERSKRDDRDGYHARVQLERLDRGQSLPESLEYPIQTWTFGDDLAMVHLAGEVVVDYALRLDRDFDRSRLWVNAYTNDVPCYIPSKRVLREGGYEPDRSMRSYDRPTQFASNVEDLIADTIQRLLPAEFYSDEKQLEYPAPKSPEASRQSIQTRDGLRVELIAAEPLVVDPVAIDFGVDGRLWVAEYLDYPTGMQEGYEPGGRIKYLTDTDKDGRYDQAVVLLEDVPFPTGIMEWRGGVLIASAPDILYAKDTSGDGKADVRKVLFTGFETDNFQARVNGFRLGLDNFVHGSSGRRAEFIQQVDRVAHNDTKANPPQDGAEHRQIKLGRRDFRIDPDLGIIEGVSGGSQNARIRDDWGNWFGSTAGSMLFHYPLTERYLRRNPFVAPPATDVLVPAGGESAMRLFPISRTLMRFNNPMHFNRATSACGAAIYRDDLLGADLYGNALICETVHNLITRLRLSRDGLTFRGHRVDEEANREFLASSDNWFRPVQVRTGPDGALWIVDMYRFVIEHPRWIGPERLRKLDVRAGEDKGRIYRVYPSSAEPSAIKDLHSKSTRSLAAAIDSPNGPTRDLIHRELLHRGDRAAIGTLRKLAKHGRHAAARLQALCVLDGLKALSNDTRLAALTDNSANVRRHAVRLSENKLGSDAVLAESILNLESSRNPMVRAQLSMTLGQWDDPRAGDALAGLALSNDNDAYSQAAILSSAVPHLGVLVAEALESKRAAKDLDLLEKLIQIAVRAGDVDVLSPVFRKISTIQRSSQSEHPFRLLAVILDGLDSDNKSLAQIGRSAGTELRQSIDNLRGVFHLARASAMNTESPWNERKQAIRLLGRGFDRRQDDLELLLSMLSPQQPSAVQASAVAALGKLQDESVVEAFIGQWRQYSPTTRSRVLDELFRQKASVRSVVRAIHAGDLPAADLDASRRAVLLNHADRQIRDQARELFEHRDAPRHTVVESYRSALSQKGSSTEGKLVFSKQCAKCHRFGDLGTQVGPDLASMSNRSSSELLIAILDPNRAVEPRYQSYVCVTSDGRILNGTLAGETATSIALLGPEGKQQVVLRTDIEQLSSTGKSLMPEGVEKDLNEQDFADLFAYLTTSNAQRKQFPENQPTTIQADLNGVFDLLPVQAAIYGPTLVLGKPARNVQALTEWKNENDHAVWEINVEASGDYEIWIDSMCDEGSIGNEFVVQFDRADPAIASDQTISTVGENNWYRSRRLGKINLPAGSNRITIRSRGPMTGTLFHLRAATLVPVARK